MTDEQMRDLVKECGLDWHRGYMFGDDDPINRYAVLIEAVERATAGCGCREGECESKPTGCRMAAEIRKEQK